MPLSNLLTSSLVTVCRGFAKISVYTNFSSSFRITHKTIFQASTGLQISVGDERFSPRVQPQRDPAIHTYKIGKMINVSIILKYKFVDR